MPALEIAPPLARVMRGLVAWRIGEMQMNFGFVGHDANALLFFLECAVLVMVDLDIHASTIQRLAHYAQWNKKLGG